MLREGDSMLREGDSMLCDGDSMLRNGDSMFREEVSMVRGTSYNNRLYVKVIRGCGRNVRVDDRNILDIVLIVDY